MVASEVPQRASSATTPLADDDGRPTLNLGTIPTADPSIDQRRYRVTRICAELQEQRVWQQYQACVTHTVSRDMHVSASIIRQHNNGIVKDVERSPPSCQLPPSLAPHQPIRYVSPEKDDLGRK